VVVVDLGGGLAVVRAEDAAGVLDEPSLLGDGRGEEKGIQRRAVEPFPGVRAGRDLASSVAAARWGGFRVAVNVNCCAVPGVRSSVMSRRLPACAARSVTVTVTMTSMPRGRIRPPSRVSS
jgi:hypothetical protein